MKNSYSTFSGSTSSINYINFVVNLSTGYTFDIENEKSKRLLEERKQKINILTRKQKIKNLFKKYEKKKTTKNRHYHFYQE